MGSEILEDSLLDHRRSHEANLVLILVQEVLILLISRLINIYHVLYKYKLTVMFLLFIVI